MTTPLIDVATLAHAMDQGATRLMDARATPSAPPALRVM